MGPRDNTSSTHWSLEVQSLFCFDLGSDEGLGCSVSAAAWEEFHGVYLEVTEPGLSLPS